MAGKKIIGRLLPTHLRISLNEARAAVRAGKKSGQPPDESLASRPAHAPTFNHAFAFRCGAAQCPTASFASARQLVAAPTSDGPPVTRKRDSLSRHAFGEYSAGGGDVRSG